jgi:hypothetical protein
MFASALAHMFVTSWSLTAYISNLVILVVLTLLTLDISSWYQTTGTLAISAHDHDQDQDTAGVHYWVLTMCWGRTIKFR